ncbi:MAG: hypothetical protein ACI9CB_001639 [Rhodothermales bacterium]|jgi:uncharacterized protein (TIGR02099 family)
MTGLEIMAKARTLFRRLRTLLWTALTLVVLLAAILVGIGKVLMPYSVRYQPQLEEWLSSEFQQTVVIDSFTGEWKAFGPRISLQGVTFQGDGQGEGEIAIQHAALDIKPLNALLPNRPFYSFRIIGADLALLRTADGRYEVSGLGVSGRGSGESGNSGLRKITTVGELRLEDSSLSFDDEERNIHVQLTGMKGRLQLNGSELSTELEANISDEYQTRVLGDLKATVLITLGEDQHLERASWHVKTGELMISELARQLPEHTLVPRSGWLNAEIWGGWSKDSDQLMEGVIDLRESTLSESPRLMQLDHLNTRFRWNFRDRKIWRIDLSDLTIEKDGKEWESASLSIERNIPGNLGLWLSTDFIDIEFPMQLTQRIMSSYNTVLPRLMPKRMRGQIHGLDLVLDSKWKLFKLSGELDSVDAWEWDRYPDVAGISGSLDLQGGEGEIEFGGTGIRLDWPINFRKQAVVDIPRCNMEIVWGKPGDWRIDARNCVVENEFFAFGGRSRFAGNEGKPEMDINVSFERANLAKLDDFWPKSIMSETVIDWLRRGIISGDSSAGRFSLRGDMDDWPFQGQEGVLLASADISGAELDYLEDWPNARDIDLSLEFRNTAMHASGSMGSMAGVPVQSVMANINDFKLPVLELDYSASAPMPDMLGFIESTPLLTDVDLDLDQFKFEDVAQTEGRLIAPLRSELGELSIDGRLSLSHNGFKEMKSGIELLDLTGDISYDLEGMRGPSLSALYLGVPTNLSLIADWDGDEVFRTDLSGDFPLEKLLPESIIESEPLLKRINGSSHWDIRLSVNAPQGASERETWLEMSSELTGAVMNFPAPLDKSAEQNWPVKVRYPVRTLSQAPLMSIVLEEKASMQFKLGENFTDIRSAHFHFGDSSAEMPADGFFSIGGNAAEFNLDQWMDLVIERFAQDTGDDGLEFDKATLNTADMRFLNRSFVDVELSMRYEDDVMLGEIESAGIAGKVNYRRSDDGSHSLSAEFDHLFMPEPIDEGMTMDTDPSTLPEMHLYAKEFSYMGLELGETRVEAFPIQNGLRIDSVEAVSPQVNFQARGDWTRDDSGNRSDFHILMTSEALGALMSLMEVSTVLEGGQTILTYDAWWPGPPAAFALAQLNGEMSINVRDGSILDVDAGAGRMVGLLSVAALPRRLALDFRDVFGSGFNFDQAAGTITLENGKAYTEDLALESTAATLTINGSSDLVAQSFDYVMTVRPGVSQTLPALGAVIGGPAGAGVGLALQGLLRKSLGDATEAVYTIQGPWSSPTVEPVKPASPVTPTNNGTGNE